MLISKKRIGIYLNKMTILVMNPITFKIPILTATNTLVPLYISSQNRDLKCNRIHYQYLILFKFLWSLFTFLKFKFIYSNPLLFTIVSVPNFETVCMHVHMCLYRVHSQELLSFYSVKMAAWEFILLITMKITIAGFTHCTNHPGRQCLLCNDHVYWFSVSPLASLKFKAMRKSKQQGILWHA